MKSIWELDGTIEKRSSLQGKIKTDAVVIGAGMAGILTAWKLQKKGLRVIVLEAAKIGSGQSGKTTAKITMQHNLIYDKLLKKYGKERAYGYAMANQQAIEDYRQIIKEENIACSFEEKDAYLYTEQQSQKLEQELRAMEKIRQKGYLTKKTSLPFPVASALKIEKQAQFHPLKFIAALEKDLVIYENSLVEKIEKHKAYTKTGSVEADYMIMATHYPFINFPGFYFLKLSRNRSYALAIEDGPELDGMYLGIDQDSYSFRNYDRYLLLGGKSHATGKKKQLSHQELRAAAERWYPDRNIHYQWAAQDCMPAGVIPYFGPLSKKMPYVYLMTGFQKWGMTSSMVGANIITGALTNAPAAYSEVFSPQPFPFLASAGKLTVNAGHAVGGFAKHVYKIPVKSAAALKREMGGIIWHRGKRKGAYRDENGKLYVVSLVCPHLKCMLSWNQEEKTWDCPCHGSRFDYKGNLLDNPAARRLYK